jgi:hypothetical protein
MATLAAHTQEAFLQPPALQVGVELLLHIVGQWPTGLGLHIAESGIVLLDELIQQCRFGPAHRRNASYKRKAPAVSRRGPSFDQWIS